MFNNNSGFSMPVAPIGYSNGGNGSWGDDWIALAIIAMIFGWGNGGWGGMGGGMGMFWPFMFGGFGNFGFNNGTVVTGQALTRGELCQDMNFQEVQNGIRGISDSVNLGFANLNSTICNQQYDTANMINNLGSGLQSSLNAMNIANMQNANAANIVALQNANALESQLANCCCENRAGQLAIQNQIIQQTCDLSNQLQNSERNITDAVNGGTRTIIDFLCNQENQRLRDENQTLRFEKSQEQQNQYLTNTLMPTARPAYITCSPYASMFGFPFGFNNGNNYNNNCAGCYQ